MSTEKYLPQQFEERWAKQWLADGAFQDARLQESVSPENKKYLLFAFAYPSGSGLHVGHVESMTALDILARYYRSIGKKVFFPVGWDAFGLPAENYAIKTSIPPVETTKTAIDTFRAQIKRLGISYDWKAELATCHPGYYQWTQWLFLQLYKKGLAYKKNAPVNWCPSCQTVLANEQVVEGTCERCSSEVIQKEMDQWFFKIMQYKDELIEGLKEVDWPNATKHQQLNWIGKSEGARIVFKLAAPHQDYEIPVFTTAHDTIFGATFLVVAPEHDFVSELLKKKWELPTDCIERVSRYVTYAAGKTEEERLMNKEKTGEFSGLYGRNPLTGRDIPIWIADYVLVNYGTGAIMAVAGNDERDREFAQKFNLPIVPVAHKKTSPKKDEFISYSKDIKGSLDQYIMQNSGAYDGLDFQKGRELIMQELSRLGVGKKETTYKLRDWLISRQRYWGAPIPIVYDPDGNAHPVKDEHLPWLLPTDVDFRPTGESPLRRSKEFVERVEKLYGKGWRPEYDTMDTFVDSSWYYLRYTDPRNNNSFADKAALSKWMNVDFYMIGPEHIVLHLLYSRFFTKFLRDEGYLEVNEPFRVMRHQGMILGPDGRKMSKSKGNVINPDQVITDFGADTLRMYEMFMGPIDADKPWNENSVQGVYRFLKRVWNLYQGVMNQELPLKTSSSVSQQLSANTATNLVVLLNRTIAKVTSDIENLKFNTAIAAMMEFVNEWEALVKKDELIIKKEEVVPFLKIVSVFAPFMTEEIYHTVYQGKESIHTVPWPQVDHNSLQESHVEIPVQINGKVRSTIRINQSDTQEQVFEIAKQDMRIAKYLGAPVKKTIYVKGKILNLIV